MKFSCLKNDLKNGLKPIDKFAGVFKKESLVLSLNVQKDVQAKVQTGEYSMSVNLPQVEIQEAGCVKVAYEAIQRVLKGIRRNVLLSCRLIKGPEGLALVLVTPEGEMHRLPAESYQVETEFVEAQPIMNVGMDEFWQSLLQINRVIPKKHLIEVFTKVKWVVTESAVRWVAVNQTELAIKHFQSLVSERQQLFYVKGSDMDILKKCMASISEQRLLVESTETELRLSGEAFVLTLPIESGKDVPVEKLVVRDILKYDISIPAWMEQIQQQMSVMSETAAAVTAKQLKYRPVLTNQQLELVLTTDEVERGFFSADEFLKMFKQDGEGAWQCWLPREQEPMLAFVKQGSTTTFYLYVLTAGLV